MKKKKNRRNNTKYPGLKPELNLKTRYDLLDQDYVGELPDKKVPHCSNPKGECKICNNPKTRMINPKEYLNNFNEEYVNARFNHDGKTILDEKLNLKPEVIEVWENCGVNKNITVVKVKKNNYRKQTFDSNNSRNRCILTQQKASNRLIDYEKIQEEDFSTKSPEDELLLKEASVLIKSKNRKNRKK